MRELVVGALVLAAGAMFAPSAAAANQTVRIDPTEHVYIPDRVAVKVGESVTWQNSGSQEPHNVHFDDGQFTEPSTPALMFTTPSRTFTKPGVYPYHCDQHADHMLGVVYVTNSGQLPPVADFTADPGAAVAGQAVTFNAAASTASAGRIVKYEWDLDGDGMFEVDSGSTPTTTHTYLTPQRPNVMLRVTDSSGESATRTQAVEIGPAVSVIPPVPPSDPAPQRPAPTPLPAVGPVPPSTTPKAQAASFSFRAPATASRANGATVKVTCPGRCRFTAKLSISASIARKAHLGRKITTIGSARGSRSSRGTKSVTIKLTRNARRRLTRAKSVRATLRLQMSDAAGRTSSKQKSIVLRR